MYGKIDEYDLLCQTAHTDDDREPLLHDALAALLPRGQPLPHHSEAAALHHGPTRLPAGHHAHPEKPILHDAAARGQVGWVQNLNTVQGSWYRVTIQVDSNSG